MTKIVIRDKRYHPTKYEAWKEIASYVGKDIKPIYDIPEHIIKHWCENKSPLNYASFKDLNKNDALTIIALSKGQKAHLSINRWGDVNSYKLKICEKNER